MNKDKYIKPTQITDELYCIGISGAPAHMLTTSDGIVLIDAGCPQTFEVLRLNMELLGFDIRDVRHIVHTHAHSDHVGATKQIVAVSGAKTYISEPDADAARGKNDLCWNGALNKEYFNAIEPDVIIKDGDVLKFGDTEIRCVYTPGHTVGTISLFFNVHHNGKEYLAGMFGGAGHNTLTPEYLERTGIDESVRYVYLKSIDRIIDEPVEVHIGNHHADNSHTSKMERKTADYNPFVEENTWREFLLRKRNTLIDLYGLKV